MKLTNLRARLLSLAHNGLSDTLRQETHNAVEFRRGGDLAGFDRAKDRLLNRVNAHQPEFYEAVHKILTH